MDFSSRGRRNTLILAILTLVLIGLSLMASTWQILRQQEEVSFQHMGISARAIARAMESFYRRGMGMGAGDFGPRLRELFTDVENGGDIQFIEIFDEQGLRLVVSRQDNLEQRFIPTPDQLRILDQKEEWSGVVTVRSESFFVLASRLRPLPRHMMGRHSMMMDIRPAFVAVGMSLDMHENMRGVFRHNAVLQSLYILAAAVFIWILAVTLISRRALLARNRTRLHYLERSLAEAEKMAVVGALAAGVAHEIRNPLAALRGFAQYFAKKFAGQKPDEEFAQTMVREADRLNRVIADLLYLARNKKLVRTKVNVPEVTDEVRNLLRFDLEKKDVPLERDFSLDYIWADEDALKQALLNLVLNSLDAVEACKAHAPEGYRGRIVVRAYAADGDTVLEVEDNGAGMEEDLRERAFEAFFTNKAGGTGLGLALVRKTLHEHGGRACIRSQPLQGCTVSLYFPSLPAEETAPAQEMPTEQENSKEDEGIL